jgi:hypothetical protein
VLAELTPRLSRSHFNCGLIPFLHYFHFFNSHIDI